MHRQGRHHRVLHGWRIRADRGFEASSVNYGKLPDNLDELAAGACPIVGSYGVLAPTVAQTTTADNNHRTREVQGVRGFYGGFE